MFPTLTVEPKSLFRGACSLLGSWVVAAWGLLESKSAKTLFPLLTGYKKLAKPSSGSQPYSRSTVLGTSRIFCISNSVALPSVLM